ncbi:MAG: hypothetical protein RL722_784 [Pseudomonadota bacterium]|jgi:uncharacterized protein (DUF1800 family)
MSLAHLIQWPPLPRLLAPRGLASGLLGVFVSGVLALLPAPPASAQAPSSAQAGDLAPLAAADWSPARAAHLLERAGFGATPAEVQRLAAMSPREAVRAMVHARDEDLQRLPPFDASDIFDEGLDPFPPSRPAATNLAKQTGEALGVKVKPGGNRRLQPVTDTFFYWLRASRLETDRLAQWWAQRMLVSRAPLREKAALFWHGHFANNEDKVRDVRKFQRQLALFQSQGLGSFRELLVAVAQDPAMLVFLDAGVNVKGAPNENFAREIMELFTMGVGQYSEQDIREAARAFTGWNAEKMQFRIDPAKHDDGEKTVLGRRGRLGGVEVIDLILAQPVTAEFVAGKLYRYFVRDELSPALQRQLGQLLRAQDWRIDAFLETVFLSRDFYAPETTGSRIKGPVEFVVSTYRKLGLTELPGLPDFNDTTAALGQRLFHPPTVAGWAQGRAWITPGLLMERGNFVEDTLFPHITALPRDRFPVYPAGSEIAAVHRRARAGADISTATRPVPREAAKDGEMGGNAEGGPAGAGGDMMGGLSQSSLNVDRNEDFNTRWGAYRGWQMAVERVKPIVRNSPRIRLAALVREAGCRSAEDAVDLLAARFLSLPLAPAQKVQLSDFLTRELGSAQLGAQDPAMAATLEEPLRHTLHALLSLPDYQLH